MRVMSVWIEPVIGHVHLLVDGGAQLLLCVSELLTRLPGEGLCGRWCRCLWGGDVGVGVHTGAVALSRQAWRSRRRPVVVVVRHQLFRNGDLARTTSSILTLREDISCW